MKKKKSKKVESRFKKQKKSKPRIFLFQRMGLFFVGIFDSFIHGLKSRALGIIWGKKPDKKIQAKAKKSESAVFIKNQIRKFLKLVAEKIKTPEFKREAFWVLKGIIWGWAFFIIVFFILLVFSDNIIFTLLYPGWLIVHLISNTKPSLATDFGPVLISVLLSSFLFYCLLGAILRLIIGKVLIKIKKKGTKK